jgi:CRISPR-associated protein Cas2
MGRSRLKIDSPVKSMWAFALFDLPVVSNEDKRNYTRFRKHLLAEGFLKLQFSVYARYCDTRENTQTILRRVRSQLPPEGEVRFLFVTDKQFADMVVCNGRKPKKAEDKPQQMMLF